MAIERPGELDGVAALGRGQHSAQGAGRAVVSGALDEQGAEQSSVLENVKARNVPSACRLSAGSGTPEARGLAPPLLKRLEKHRRDLPGRCGLRDHGKVFAVGAQTERPGVAWLVRKLLRASGGRQLPVFPDPDRGLTPPARPFRADSYGTGESDPRDSAVPALASKAWTSAQSCLHDSCSAAGNRATALASRRPANAGSDCQLRSHS